MVAQKTVKSLFQLAFGAVYHDVVCQLDSQLHPKTVTEDDDVEAYPPKKKRKVDSVVAAKKRNPAEILKAQLDEYLVSWYSHLRPQLIEHFIHNNYKGYESHSHFWSHVCLSFFESVLDQSFTSLNLTAVKQDSLLCLSNPTQLLEIITRCSPLLQELNFTFCSPEEAPAVDQRFGLLLGTLTHLTSLTLLFQTTGKCLDLFTSLGQSCPQLVTLCVGRVPFGTEQVLALVLGSKRALLPPAFPKDVEKLADVQFSPNSVSPICNSLKKLCFDCDDDEPCSKPPTIFLLRHIKNMQIWKNCWCERQEETQIILKWLQKKSARKSPRLLQKMKTTTASSSEDMMSSIQWTTDSPFSGMAYNF